MTSQNTPAEQPATHWRTEAFDAIKNLVGFYLDRVPAPEIDREQLADCITEGLSDELGRVYGIEKGLAILASRYEEIADRAPKHPEYLYIDPLTPAERDEHERAAAYRRSAADIREVLRTGRIPHGLMTDDELEQHGNEERAS